MIVGIGIELRGPYSKELDYALPEHRCRLQVALALAGQRSYQADLSACQTGLAEREPGSEVASLADAFSVAGVPTVIATLWSVEDNATLALMTRFYKELGQGKSPIESLRQAQLSLIKSNDRAFPFFWAGFTLYGDWR